MNSSSPLAPASWWRALLREFLPLLGSTAVLLAALIFGLVILQG